LHKTVAGWSQTATSTAQHQDEPLIVNQHAVLFCAPFNILNVHDKLNFAPCCSHVITILIPWWSLDGYFSSVIADVPLLLYHQFVSDPMALAPLQFAQLYKPPDITKDSISFHLAVLCLVVVLNSLSQFGPNSATAIVVSSGLLLSCSLGIHFILYDKYFPSPRGTVKAQKQATMLLFLLKVWCFCLSPLLVAASISSACKGWYLILLCFTIFSSFLTCMEWRMNSFWLCFMSDWEYQVFHPDIQGGCHCTQLKSRLFVWIFYIFGS
jgi:hypothetical protein